MRREGPGEAAVDRELLTQADLCGVGGHGARLGGKDAVHEVRKAGAGKVNGGAEFLQGYCG